MPCSGDQVLELEPTSSQQLVARSLQAKDCPLGQALRSAPSPAVPAETSSAKAICDEGTNTPGLGTPGRRGSREGRMNKGELCGQRVRKWRACPGSV